jgi:hypothetical protein
MPLLYNYVEKLRDPSHIKALTFAELQKMFKEIGLTIINTDSYGIEMELERLLQSSFPNPGDKDKIRQLFIEDVQNNILGVNSHYVGAEIHFTYPTSMIIAQKTYLLTVYFEINDLYLRHNVNINDLYVESNNLLQDCRF